MTDPTPPAKSALNTVDVSLTSSATSVLNEAADLYVQSVIAQSRVYSRRQEVAAEHVERAVRQLSPAYEAAGLKVALDWIKRVGFLIVGVSISQFAQLLVDVGKHKATSDEMVRVVVLLIVGAALVVAAVAIDLPALLNWTAARRVKREIATHQSDETVLNSGSTAASGRGGGQQQPRW